MSNEKWRLYRVEGGASLASGPDGLYLESGPSRFIEHSLAGRPQLEAIYLTQQITADGGVAHALAAVKAWEDAGGLSVAENGRVLRELLHALSIIHAHLRQYYYQALPDYLPPGTLKEYSGFHPDLRRISQEISRKSTTHWTRFNFTHPFTEAEVNHLWEQSYRIEGALVVLQRMMAALGGKFPQIMSIVPGGVSVRLSEALLLRLRDGQNELRRFISRELIEDVNIVLKGYPHLGKMGKGLTNFMCVGEGESDAALESSLFPSGFYLEGKLERFTSAATESIEHSFYQLAQSPGHGRRGLQAAPGKENAYSWIKAPRHAGHAMESGPFSRLLIAYLSGSQISDPTLVESIQQKTAQALNEANTVGGRLLAAIGEVVGLLDHCEILLDQLDPAQPAILNESDPLASSGEGIGHAEGPAGTIRHVVTLDGGRIVNYDIIGPSTWNGSPRTPNGKTGGLETALNHTDLDPENAEDRLDISRIIHSFFFSMSDAIH
ncbi:MAG: nickel-dependent hydrogenase large subunit [Deltaproteobacteria bacterium]|nr:nickel-dependent hydrogenase large subunit [Deltaproteobacteria bacterium]